MRHGMRICIVGDIPGPKNKSIVGLRLHIVRLTPHLRAQGPHAIGYKKTPRWRVGMVGTRKAAVMKNSIGTDGVGIFRTERACKNPRHVLHIGGKSSIARTEIAILNQIHLLLAQRTLRSEQNRYGETNEENELSHGDSLNLGEE